MIPKLTEVINKDSLMPMTFVVLVAGWVWFLATAYKQIEINTTMIMENRAEIRQTPSRTEYDEFKNDIKEGMKNLNTKLDTLINGLINTKN